MATQRTMAGQKLLRALLLCCVLFPFTAGCIPGPKTHSSSKSIAKPVDAKAQQHYYDLGLRYYLKENYKKAKRAFQIVVENGPNTELGLKARENLKKIEQILKTLEEMESK
jgi:outer membrane protein assembly factor BamD (BamD/ComL family)